MLVNWANMMKKTFQSHSLEQYDIENIHTSNVYIFFYGKIYYVVRHVAIRHHFATIS